MLFELVYISLVSDWGDSKLVRLLMIVGIVRDFLLLWRLFFWNLVVAHRSVGWSYSKDLLAFEPIFLVCFLRETFYLQDILQRSSMQMSTPKVVKSHPCSLLKIKFRGEEEEKANRRLIAHFIIEVIRRARCVDMSLACEFALDIPHTDDYQSRNYKQSHFRAIEYANLSARIAR